MNLGKIEDIGQTQCLSPVKRENAPQEMLTVIRKRSHQSPVVECCSIPQRLREGVVGLQGHEADISYQAGLQRIELRLSGRHAAGDALICGVRAEGLLAAGARVVSGSRWTRKTRRV